jgi:hypothetical protein
MSISGRSSVARTCMGWGALLGGAAKEQYEDVGGMDQHM